MSNLDLEKLRNNNGKDAIDQLKKGIVTYNKDLAIKSIGKLIDDKENLTKVIKVITNIIKSVGDSYGEGELFLPDLVGASETMSAVMPIIEKEILKDGKKLDSLGIVVLGTVFGDIHNIGKNLVKTMLIAEGFIVYDIGINVPAKGFIEAVKNYNADILAMSTLLTTTAQEQKEVMSIIKREMLGKRIKVMIGGGAVTQDFANDIGADGYESTAPKAAKLARRLINK